MTRGIASSSGGSRLPDIGGNLGCVIRTRKNFLKTEGLSKNEGKYDDGSWTPRTNDILFRSQFFSNPELATRLMLIGRRNSQDDAEKLPIGYYSEALDQSQELTDDHIDNAQFVANGLYDFVKEKRLVAQEQNILELGSGLGFFVQNLDNDNINTIGIEPKEQLVERGDVMNNNQGFLDGSRNIITSLDDENQKFNRIFMNAPFACDEAGVTTLKRYLKDDGKLILSIPTNGLMETVFALKELQNDSDYNPSEYLNNVQNSNIRQSLMRATNFAKILNEHFDVETIYDAITEKEKTNVNELIGGGFAFVVVLTPKEEGQSSHTS